MNTSLRIIIVNDKSQRIFWCYNYFSDVTMTLNSLVGVLNDAEGPRKKNKKKGLKNLKTVP